MIEIEDRTDVDSEGLMGYSCPGHVDKVEFTRALAEQRLMYTSPEHVHQTYWRFVPYGPHESETRTGRYEYSNPGRGAIRCTEVDIAHCADRESDMDVQR